MLYAFTENFMLPLSHDEVVHGKGSLLGKMPGDDWQQLRQPARLLSATCSRHPGKKLLFMGCELGQWREWNHAGSLDWHLLQYPRHRACTTTSPTLNRLYKSEPALYEVDSQWQGFEWIDFHDVDSSVISFVRRARNPRDFLVFVCNFTPLPRVGYLVGVPEPGLYKEVLDSDWLAFGGSGVCNDGELWTHEGNVQNRNQHLVLTLPPLGITVLRHVQGQ